MFLVKEPLFAQNSIFVFPLRHKVWHSQSLYILVVQIFSFHGTFKSRIDEVFILDTISLIVISSYQYNALSVQCCAGAMVSCSYHHDALKLMAASGVTVVAIGRYVSMAENTLLLLSLIKCRCGQEIWIFRTEWTCKKFDFQSFHDQNTVRCHYNVVDFLKNITETHPIARPLGWGMGCLLWIQHLIDILP